MVTSGDWKGGDIVKLDSALSRPSSAEVAMNYHLLLPVLQHIPDRVPSGYFLTDVFLRMDALFQGKLLRGNKATLQLAADEGVKLKQLVGGLRALWRSSPKGHHPNVTHLKSLLRPSPSRGSKASSPGDPSDPEDFGAEGPDSEPEEGEDGEEEEPTVDPEVEVADGESFFSGTTLRLPGKGSDGEAPRTESDDSDEGDSNVGSPAAAHHDEAGAVPDESSSEESCEKAPLPDSQREGAWMGSAYSLFNGLEHTGKKVVPCSTLYEWLVDGKPAKKGEFKGTFFKEDVT
eukprot:Skav234048  [mRNA]  locus=scaffold619:33907:34875:- [translate_table: standard]